MRTAIEIRSGLSIVLTCAVAACGSGGPSSDAAGDGRLNVHVSTAALDSDFNDQTVAYNFVFYAEDAADPTHFVPTLDTIVMPTESDGSFTGVFPCHGSDAGLAGKADVVATLKDANGGVVGTGDATTLFDCKAGADTPVSLDVSIPVAGSAGFVDISVRVDATEVSAMTDTPEGGGQPTVVTGRATKGVVTGVMPGMAEVRVGMHLAVTNAPATPVDVDKGVEKASQDGGGAEYFDTRWTVDAMAPAFTLAQFDADLGPPRGTTCQLSCTAGFRSMPVTVVHEAGIAIDEPGVHFTDVGNAVAGLAVRDEHGVIVEGVVVDGRGLTPDDMPSAYGLGVVSASTGSTVLVGPEEFHGIIGPEHPAVAADSQVSIASSTLYLARNADGSPLDIVGLGAIELDGGKLAVLVGVFGPNGPPIPPPASVTVPGLPWYPMMKGDFSRGHQPDRLYVALCAVVDGKLGCEEDVPGSGYLALKAPRDRNAGNVSGR